MQSKDQVVIVAMARTAFGAFQGVLSSVSAPKLGAVAIKQALERGNISPKEVSSVIMGNVLSSALGQAPARQAALYAGLGQKVPCLTINKVCGSGLKSLHLAQQSLLLGESQIVVAGGMENMSAVPYYLSGARDGLRLGNHSLIDGMVHDGLTNPYDGKHMGLCGELCAKEEKFSREEQDAFAIESFQRARKAMQEGWLSKDIAVVEVKKRRESVLVKEDEGPHKVNLEKVPSLRPAFDKEGSITAANASSINDGACACVLMTRSEAEKRGLMVLATLVSFAEHAKAPEYFTTAPIEAMQKACKKAEWNMEDIDLFEVNEAFAVVSMAAQKHCNIPKEKLNIGGGAISIGHPIGASGTRIVMQLIRALEEKKQKRGLAAICIGGGEGLALCLEREGV